MGFTISGGYDSSSISTLFSSLNTSNSSTSSLSSMTSVLSEYNSIKTGSYYKLLKSYYAKTSDATSASEDTDEVTDSSLSKWKTEASDLADAASTLLAKGTDSVFSKVEKKNEDGTTSYGYDTDKIYSAVKDFVDSYNTMISGGSDAKLSGVKTAVSSMVGLSVTDGALLKSVGISISTNGKLSIDETTFKKSDMSTVKSLFQTTGGYAYQISAKASNIRSAVLAEAGNGNYTKTGAISTSDLMSSYNSYI